MADAAVDARAVTRNGARFISLPGDDDLVEKTPMLDWQADAGGAAAAPRAILPHAAAMSAFAPRFHTGPAIPDQVQARACNVLTLQLGDGAWTRCLTELRDSGLAVELENAGAATVQDFVKVYRALSVSDSSRLAIQVGDYAHSEEFDTPAVPQRGHSGRGRAGGGVSVPAVLGPPELRFLSLATIPYLEDPGSDFPWQAVARLAGALGPCDTRAVRLDEMSTVRATAEPLAAGIRQRYGQGGDGHLARNLKMFMVSCYLPAVVAAASFSEQELSLELLDAIAYTQGGSAATSVLASRLHLLRAR